MNGRSADVLAAIRTALKADPRNAGLWAHFGSLLQEAGETAEAIDALRNAISLDPADTDSGLLLVGLLRAAGQVSEALIRGEELVRAEPRADLHLEMARVHLARGDSGEASEQYEAARELDPSLVDEEIVRALAEPSGGDETSSPSSSEVGTPAAEHSASDTPVSDTADAPEENTPESDTPVDTAADGHRASVSPEPADADELIGGLDLDSLVATFSDVVGLEEVKGQIELRIIAPFKNREIYRAFSRQAGGGLLLYGPPGCGKTFIARATAGECGARFLSVSIAEVVDHYWGMSEKFIRGLFEDARRQAPTVLFFDEFDALGSSRGKSDSQFWRTLVNQILHEMDGMGGKAEGVLVFAATNLPWNVDPAFRRPGRFDRTLFVPPPDLAGREELLAKRLAQLPGGNAIDVGRVAQSTDLMTGADLVALCDRAAERALTESLRSNAVHSIEMRDFDSVLSKMQSSALEWLSSARNYARYSNDGGHYDDLVQYLKSVKRW